jgi:hypothetical protein
VEQKRFENPRTRIDRSEFFGAWVFITAGPSTKLCAWGGGAPRPTGATRDDEPRPVWTSLPITHFFGRGKGQGGRMAQHVWEIDIDHGN